MYKEDVKYLKIGFMNKHTENKLNCAITGTLMTILVSLLIFKIAPFDFLDYFNNKDKVFELIMIIPVEIFILVIHELIHIAVYKLFGKGQARISVEKEKKLGAIVVHQTNEDVFYTKPEMLAILLSPMVILTIVLTVIFKFTSYPFLIYINIALNLIGSSIDFYISMLLIKRYPKDILVNFNSEDITMNIYKLN